MAAPMRLSLTALQTKFCTNSHSFKREIPKVYSNIQYTTWRGKSYQHFKVPSAVSGNFGSGSQLQRCLVAGGVALGGFYLINLYKKTSTVLADVSEPLKHKPIRQIRSDTDTSGLKLTLFQYQTCPFCCKVRAYLDSHGFSYNVVEVNSVWRTQTKWTKYKKVPILVIHGMGQDGYLQVNDSSVIISALETFLVDKKVPMDKIIDFYPSIEGKNSRGKTVLEYPNKYFVMYNETEVSKADQKKMKDERDWRSWTDDVLVHVISPNIYRSPSEALQSFKYFSQVGEWEKVFSTPERLLVIYVGTLAMYAIGKILKKRHHLSDDVRQSLYDAGDEWMKGIGKQQPYMGGDKPNLADISVYGSLNAMEGCGAFQDLLKNTDIGPWFYRVKQVLERNAGHRLPDNIVVQAEAGAVG